MVFKDFFGIELRDDRWLMVAHRCHGRPCFHRRFNYSVGSLSALVAFIRARATQPRVCMNAVGEAAIKVALQLGRLTEAEVVLLSSHGWQHLAAQRLPASAPPSVVDQALWPAARLAWYAECLR
ncbi:MAG: hypothetical protein U1F76_23180 [Candidatus Competibacteraceae bacterium]